MKTIPLKTRNRKAVFQKVHQKQQFLRKLKLIIKASHTSRTIIEEDFSTDLLEIGFYLSIEYILIHLSSDNFLGTLMMVKWKYSLMWILRKQENRNTEDFCRIHKEQISSHTLLYLLSFC